MSETFDLNKFLISIALFIGIIAIGYGAALTMRALRPEVPKSDPPSTLRSVVVREVTNEDVRTDVVTNGVVEPHTQTQIVTEVTGRIVKVSPRFESGEIVDEGELLLEIDPSIYRANVASARAELAAAQAALDREAAEGEIAKAEWEKFGQGDASDLVLRKPQLAQSRARVDAAKATLERAEVDLERTTVRAPFTGRFRECLVDVGQYVTAGTRAATLYAIDFVEVRIPIPVDDLAYLEIPLDASMIDEEDSPTVTLSARMGGQRHEWTGRVARTEGRIDPRTRTISALVRVDDPYRRNAESTGHPPLLIGTFIEATIRGRVEKNVAQIPRSILRNGTVVPVVTMTNPGDRETDSQKSLRDLEEEASDARASIEPSGEVAHADDAELSSPEPRGKTGILHLRTIEVVRLEANTAIVRGLENGELIATTPLDVAIDGMNVGIVENGDN